MGCVGVQKSEARKLGSFVITLVLCFSTAQICGAIPNHNRSASSVRIAASTAGASIGTSLGDGGDGGGGGDGGSGGGSSSRSSSSNRISVNRNGVHKYDNIFERPGDQTEFLVQARRSDTPYVHGTHGARQLPSSRRSLADTGGDAGGGGGGDGHESTDEPTGGVVVSEQ